MLFVQPVSTRASQLTPSTINRTIGRAAVTDESERRMALIPPLSIRFLGTRKRYALGGPQEKQRMLPHPHHRRSRPA